MIRELISPSLRFELREAFARLRVQFSRACFWRWVITRIQQQGNHSCDILYVGRKAQRELAMALLRGDSHFDAVQVGEKLSNQTAFVAEMPVPGSLSIPWYLSAVVRLGRPIEEITAEYDGELRRTLRKIRTHYRMQQAQDDAEIERADREMLQPYAKARHGNAVAQIGPDVVRKMAKKFGRLDFVLLSDEVVACHLGCVVTRAGKRFWSTIRFGYPEKVFSDLKRLRETNSITTYLALEWAIQNNFDYYDIGTCLGRPDDGLLQWKRRRGGAVDMMGNHGYFYVRLPRKGAAKFLWDSPLFSVERRHLTLHLGLPEGPSDEEIAIRYREMGFGGLSKIYLHCARLPNERLLDKLRSLYTHQKSPPIVEIIPST